MKSMRPIRIKPRMTHRYRTQWGPESIMDAIGLGMAVLDCGDVLEVLKLVEVFVVLDISKSKVAEVVMIAVAAAAVAGLASKNMLIKLVRYDEVMVVSNPRIF